MPGQTLLHALLLKTYPALEALESINRLSPGIQFQKLPSARALFHKSRKICTIEPEGRGRVESSRASEVIALIKQDIVHHVIERTGLPRTKAEAAVDTVFEGLKQALAAGERIELRGFGVFSVRARKTGIGRNPRTGTEVSITPGKAVRFKPGKELHTLADTPPAS